MALGIKLLLVGMTTVFIMLFLVIISGKLLIKITDGLDFDALRSNGTAIPKNQNHEAAIRKAVALISGGHKQVEKIQKL